MADEDLEQVHSAIKVWIDVGLKLGTKFDESMATINARMDALQKNTPRSIRLPFASTYPASGSLFLDLGTPESGRFWELALVGIGGTEITDTRAGSAGLYIVSSITNSTTGGMINLGDRAATLPNVAFYSRGQFPVQANEHLVLVIFGGTAGQIYAGNVLVNSFDVAAAGGKTVNEV